MTKLRQEIFRLVRFGIVGGINTVLAYLVFALCLRGGMHFALATLAGNLFGMVLGFNLHGRLVFGNPGEGRFLRFCIFATLLYGLGVGVQGVARLRVNGYVAGVISAMVTVPLSFLLNRRFVFHEW